MSIPTLRGETPGPEAKVGLAVGVKNDPGNGLGASSCYLFTVEEAAEAA